jgi:ribosomal protein S18 acetylase RimI-like enzyme
MNEELVLPPGYALRLASEGDSDFLFELFCSARSELALLPLPKTQLEQLMKQQYEWQQKGYSSQYPDANNWMIETQSAVVGKVTLLQSASMVHIIDFIVAPEWRNRGVGSTVLNALKKYVARNSTVLRLSVDRQNFHAKRLYLRLGFAISQTSDTHEQLYWSSTNQLAY